MTKFDQMAETKTRIREIFFDISSLLLVSRSLTHRENARTAQPTAVRTAYCVIASNSVFSNV